jgi:hypothetical protein
MRRLSSCAALLAAVIAFGGCSFVDDSVVPSLSGEDPAASSPQRVAIPPSAGELAAQSDAGSVESRPIQPGSPTGTEVGRRIQSMRAELNRINTAADQYNNQFRGIRDQTQQSTQRYHATVAAINSRLQVGTTPGNPILIQQWNTAQQQLDSISADVTKTSGLVNQVATESAAVGYLHETTRAAFNLSGAVEEDPKQLSTLADDVSRSKVAIDRLLSEVTDEVTRQSDYLSTERRSLTTLSLAIKNGNMTNVASGGMSAAPRSAVSLSAPASSTATNPASSRRPLVVIRFDRPDVEYQQALYSAVNRALEVRPQAVFDLVAVAPPRGSTTQAQRNAENVLRSLANMGLPANRISMSAMSSPAAKTNEVHLYVR